MAIQHYEGELGTFDYDDEEFAIRANFQNDDYDSFASDFGERLKYVGEETDGSKIYIPDGLNSTRGMFYYCNIKTPPVIPNSVKDCSYMFYGCKNLEFPSIIPTDVKSCCGMFVLCGSLKTAPVIPEGIKDCHYMFCRCHKLEVAPEIPEGVENCEEMFYGCRFLKAVSTIPDGVKDCHGMFYGCESLEAAPVIPNSVKDCHGMFYCCDSFKVPPEIPDGVEDCSEMFWGCRSLKTVPVIPNNVNNCNYMFTNCSDGIRKAGGWNIEHRGQSYEDVLDETIKKYGLSDVSKDFNLSMKMNIVDLDNKCKNSNPCYSQILDSIKDGFITDPKSLKQEIEVMDKCIEQMKIDKRKKQVSTLSFDSSTSVSEDEYEEPSDDWFYGNGATLSV